jgi:hypothetical protein
MIAIVECLEFGGALPLIQGGRGGTWLEHLSGCAPYTEYVWR